MSLRREQQAELEKVFYDFMEYYKYKNNKYNWYNPHHPMHPCDYYDKYGNCYHIDKDEHPHHHKNDFQQTKPMPKPPKMPYTTLPYYFITPFRADEYTLDPRATQILTPATVCDKNETFPTTYTPTYETMNMTTRVDMNQSEQAYYKALFDDLNKALMPIVEQVIKNNNFEGSPINDKYFDKESLSQLISEVLMKAKDNPELVNFVEDLDPKVRELMRNIVQALLLGELFVVHRPNTNLNEQNMTPMPYTGESPRLNYVSTIKEYAKDCNCNSLKHEPRVKTKSFNTIGQDETQYFSN